MQSFIQKLARGMRSFFNARRLRDYPRLMLAAFVIVAAINLVFHDHWQGRVHGIIGFDFMAFYSSGLLYWNNTQNLYNFEAIAQVEQTLIAPTSLAGGVNIFSYPPYVAMVCGGLTLIPYTWAWAISSLLSLLAILISATWIANKIIPKSLYTAGLNTSQLFVVTLSFFPTYIGLVNGQNHAITLLLLTGIVLFSVQEKWELAGAMAGLLIYKPQFVIAFLVIWLVWRKYRALIPFVAVAGIWAGLVLVTKGIAPYLDYLATLPQLFMMPFGVARSVEITIPALIGTLLGPNAASAIRALTLVLTAAASIGLGWLAWRYRQQPMAQASPIFALAVLFPILVSPHALIYDLIILVLVLALWAYTHISPKIFWSAVFIYPAVFVLPLLSQAAGISLLALLPLWILVAILFDLPKLHSPKAQEETRNNHA